MNRQLKAFLSKVNFSLGRSPAVESCNDFRQFIPEPYEAVVLISADFELAWAPRYDKSADDPLAFALQLARRERENVPKIVEVSEKYNIPITWATVGHLFLDACEVKSGRKHSEIPVVAAYEGPFWDFSGLDWFEHDPCTDSRQDPEWYAPDLIEMILESPVSHEIGCHTFSHIDCRDGVCSPDLMRAELKACKQLASKRGLSLKSFVHPGHTIGNLDTLAAEGFTSFRTDYRNVLGYPRRHSNGLWEYEQTAEFNFRKGWTVRYHIHRYKEVIRRAMQSNTLCTLWFHPSFDARVVEEIWPEVFRFLDQNRDAIWITTHGEYADFLNQQVGQ